MSKSFKKSRNEQEEYKRQQLLRDREFLKHEKRKAELAEMETTARLAEYRRLKGELV